ncbi:MAG: four helix bundle protein [Bacteroidota bacterium]
MENQKYTDLTVYKECRRLRIAVSEVIKTKFPPSERFLLTAQLLDASRSITANIAEGHGRYYYQDNIRFCRIARGSLEETLEHLVTAYDEKYVSADFLKGFKQKHEACIMLLNGYIRYLRKSKRGKADDEN